MLHLNDSLMDSLVAAHLDLHTRFPVCEQKGDPQSIVGYVTFKDIVTTLKLNPQEPSIRGILREVPGFQEETPISTALERLLREHSHIALVRDLAGRVTGLITLEDIVEELVGDIQDEHDLLPVHVIRAGNGWLIGGGATLTRIRNLTGVELTPSSGSHNLSAWIIERLGTIPSGSEMVREGDLRVLVRKVRRQRVLEAGLIREPMRTSGTEAPHRTSDPER